MPLFFAKFIERQLIFSNKKAVGDYFKENEDYKGEYVVTIEKLKGKRTPTQNNALHKYYELLSDALNSGGITVQLFLSKVVDLDWTPHMIKEALWKPLQLALTGKKSTTELDKVSDINLIHEHINRHLAQEFHLDYVPFPHKEEDKREGPEYPTQDNKTSF